jgi:hypothetical protein
VAGELLMGAGARASLGWSMVGAMPSVFSYSDFEIRPFSNKMRARHLLACNCVAAWSICLMSSGVKMPLARRIAANGSRVAAAFCCAGKDTEKVITRTIAAKTNLEEKLDTDRMAQYLLELGIGLFFVLLDRIPAHYRIEFQNGTNASPKRQSSMLIDRYATPRVFVSNSFH